MTANSGKVGHRRGGGDHGGTLIETALCLALLMMLTFGAAEFGYFFYVKNVMAGAARNGVRAAIPSTAVNADVLSAVTTSMTSAGIRATAYTVTISPPDVSDSSVVAGTPITVTVSGAWGTVGVTPLSGPLGGIGANKQVTGVAVMQREQ